jgi:AAA domain
VIAVGDSGQLASVQAGGWFTALTRQRSGPELREVLRQRDPAEREALAALHDGSPEVYLEHKANRSRSTPPNVTPSKPSSTRGCTHVPNSPARMS